MNTTIFLTKKGSTYFRVRQRLLILTLFISCNTADSKVSVDANKYFIEVYTSLADFKSHHNLLMDKCTKIINNVAVDNFQPDDTIGIDLLLANARVVQKSSYANIKEINEIDKEIGFRNKSLDYLNEADIFYQKHFNEFISLASIPRKKDSITTLKTVSNSIKHLNQKNKNVIASYLAFKNKYKISVITN